MSTYLNESKQKMETAQNEVEQAAKALLTACPQVSLNSLYTAINNERDALQVLLKALDVEHRATGSHTSTASAMRTIGHAIEWGAGFGIGEDIVHKIL